MNYSSHQKNFKPAKSEYMIRNNDALQSDICDNTDYRDSQYQC